MATRLDSTQISQLRRALKERLEGLRDEVRAELLRSDDERYVELAGRVHDPGDESVAGLLVDVNLAVVDRHIEAIRETEAALLRLARGTYGVCVDCEGDIGFSRLQTEPAALRCYPCQERHERAYAQPGRATL
jgi:RNA polymerase-binding transcription factor DksA